MGLVIPPLVINIFGSEFIAKVEEGQKEFKGIKLDFADLSGRIFQGILITDSKITFTSLRNCKFNNVVFENCEMLFAAYGFSEFTSAKFIKCKIDYSGFTMCNFENTTMTDTELTWVSFLDANVGGLEMRNCTEFSVLRNLAELTPSAIDGAMAQLGPLIQHLDFDMQTKIRNLLKDFEQKYNVKLPTAASSLFGVKGLGSDIYRVPHSGYKVFDNIIDSGLEMYGQKNPYKSKHPYEKK